MSLDPRAAQFIVLALIQGGHILFCSISPILLLWFELWLAWLNFKCTSTLPRVFYSKAQQLIILDSWSISTCLATLSLLILNKFSGVYIHWGGHWPGQKILLMTLTIKVKRNESGAHLVVLRLEAGGSLLCCAHGHGFLGSHISLSLYIFVI